MTKPRRCPNNILAFIDAACDESFQSAKELKDILGDLPPRAVVVVTKVLDRQHNIRLAMFAAGAPIIIDTPRGAIEIDVAYEAKA